MKIGTRSVLFGVHQFLWHPLTVALAWKRVHRRWPTWWETICIFCHDLGYIGKSDMDGLAGKFHPYRGAEISFNIVSAVCWLLRKSPSATSVLTCRAYKLTLYHSSSLSRIDERNPSALYLPDKVSLLFDPHWFYLLRARLSGEIVEYIERSPLATFSEFPNIDKAWLAWYRMQVEKKLELHEKTAICPL